MTANLFRSKLQALGIETIAALNQPFDPNLEQAVGRVKVENPDYDGVVVEEVQPGYLHERPVATARTSARRPL